MLDYLFTILFTVFRNSVISKSWPNVNNSSMIKLLWFSWMIMCSFDKLMFMWKMTPERKFLIGMCGQEMTLQKKISSSLEKSLRNYYKERTFVCVAWYLFRKFFISVCILCRWTIQLKRFRFHRFCYSIWHLKVHFISCYCFVWCFLR